MGTGGVEGGGRGKKKARLDKEERNKKRQKKKKGIEARKRFVLKGKKKTGKRDPLNKL